jgi:glycosyltransferase involved in cell wall biosynthesis
MRVLHITASDSSGAGRAAYRLHKALVQEGIDSYMLVQKKFLSDNRVLSFNSYKDKCLNFIRPVIDQLPARMYNKKNILFSPAWIGNKHVFEVVKKLSPDIVHLHWINGGMIKIEDLKKFSMPLVWSLHDDWAYTGGCHIKWDCEKYKSKCESCFVLNSSKKDLSTWIFNRKKRVYKDINNIVINGISSWINKCAKESFLLKDKRHVNIFNLIDTNFFKSIDKKIAREILGLPFDKKLILFGAINATSDINKGFNKLKESLKYLNISDNAEIVVFGNSEMSNDLQDKFKMHYLGKLNDEISLVILYSAVDVLVVPSIQENLSNVIMESLSCSTPVVAFNVGGNSDMINHMINGYLAKPFNAKDLAKGIDWILGLSESEYKKMCDNARKRVKEMFDSKVVAKEYIKLYKELI